MENMRADRLLSLLLLLQNRGRLTATELAAELEVSVRTVYRDVEALGAAGIPVVADRGPAGGYRLMDGYRTRLTGLTEAQAGSLFLAGMPQAAAELGLGADLAMAQLKVRAALPAELGERTRRVQERFHLDSPGWFRTADPVPHLAAVAAAVWEQRLLRVHYRRWRGEVRRVLQPLGLVLKGGIWYLIACAAQPPPDGAHEASRRQPDPPRHDAARDEASARTYRVSRLLDVQPTGEHFERPAGFDLAAHWHESARRMEAEFLRGTAVLRLTERGRRLLPLQFGELGARALRDADPADEFGRVQVRMRVEKVEVAVHDLLRLGAEAEVVAPAELRTAMIDTVSALALTYREPA